MARTYTHIYMSSPPPLVSSAVDSLYSHLRVPYLYRFCYTLAFVLALIQFLTLKHALPSPGKFYHPQSIPSLDFRCVSILNHNVALRSISLFQAVNDRMGPRNV